MLKEDIVSGSMLERPKPHQRFYIKTDWSKYWMGEVLLQEDYSAEARKGEAKEKDDRKFKFGKSQELLRLRLIYFISRTMMSSL